MSGRKRAARGRPRTRPASDAERGDRHEREGRDRQKQEALHRQEQSEWHPGDQRKHGERERRERRLRESDEQRPEDRRTQDERGWRESDERPSADRWTQDDRDRREPDRRHPRDRRDEPDEWAQGELDQGDERDGGLATVWTAGAIAAVFVLVAAVLAIGSATVIRHRAESAADLAAIAAAEYAPSGEEVACDQARSVAERMRVQIADCRLSGWDALVETSADLPEILGPFGPAHSHARAGPAAS